MTMSTQRQDPLFTRAYTWLIHIGGLIRRSSTRVCAPLLRIGGLILGSSAFLVAGQLFFAFAAWAFVGFLVYHGQIPFRDSTVDRISRYHSETTLLVTLTATAISILSSFFFTKVIGRALASRLCRPISLDELRTGIELSRRSFVLGWGWLPIATILLVVILNTLTAAWATILTPSFIVVNVKVTGLELDLATLRTPATNGSLEPQLYPGPTDTSPLRWSFGPDVTPPIDVSPALSWGTSAGLGGLGVPSMQTVQLFGPPVFNISTGGMFPAAPTNITDIMSGAAAPAHVASDTPYLRGLSTNYTILQQGFTVDVECRAQSFSDTGSGFPSMTLFNASLPLPPLSESQPGSSSPLVSWAWSTNCTAYSSSYVGSISVSNAGEYPARVLAGAVCPFQDFDGSSNQSALVLIQSVNGSYYSGPSELSMVCEITPFITTIRVQYSGTTANISDVVDKTRLNADGSNWPLLFGPAKTLAMIFYSSQGMSDNYIVNSMIFTMAKLASNDATAESILESYVRGMVEYWGTMHRTLLYINAILPDDMMIPTNGTMLVTTMGWQYDASTHSFALVPITIVMILTLLAAYIARREKHKSHSSSEHVAHQSFDPSDPLHVILTSRSGGHYQASGALSDRDLTGYKSLQVQLEVGDDGMAVLARERCGKEGILEENMPATSSAVQVAANSV